MDRTPNEIIRGILDSQVAPEVIEKASYFCYMDNVGKILDKLGERDLAIMVRARALLKKSTDCAERRTKE